MKLDILFHYDVNPNTGEITFIGKEELTVDTATSTKKITSKTTKVEENAEPLIKLDSNKLILTTGAVEFMNVQPDCRLDIKYKKKDNISMPVIGTDTAFGTKGGNRLTKSNTISFRGSANEKLSEFGTEFKLEPSDDEGIFYLIGDKSPVVDNNTIDIENELDITSLDELDIEDGHSNDLSNFDFTI